ncbi:MAG: hypothetical protein NC344_10245 [Bacteroidales bacterium]|nr:hypothetical protein [Bacteroidales bacterium]MCM1148184.1 hypothetical protein [Bacteroidales bacterium]MCM1207089.1 hypothetical protein [Bacillota bacterium]MCM1510833.1 hypothetical protein [Clostridium sp.]
MGNFSNPAECFVFNDGNSANNSILAMLPALLQKQGVDPSLIAMCTNRGGFGNNGLSDIIALVVILAIFGNNGFGGLFGGSRSGFGGAVPGIINNDSNTQLLMQMLQRNGVDIQSLANMTNTSSDAIIAAVNGVSREIYSLGSAQGQSFNQILTAIMQGDNSLQSQLATCCCTLRDAITQQGFQNQLGLKDIQNTVMTGVGTLQTGMDRGFAQMGYQMATDVCGIKQTIDANGDRIIAKLDQQDKDRMQREITALTAENATLKARAERQAELAPAIQKLNDIDCKQPNTVNVPYQPFVTVPNCVAYGAGLYGLNGVGQFGGQFG